MLIINADDWGGWPKATDAALRCWQKQRITSVTAMVFMQDSERAADLARSAGIDIGLHLNFTQPFTSEVKPRLLAEYQYRISRFLTLNKYALVLYNPLLRREFRYVYEAQVDEFERIYERPPSHVDGHQHKHLCTNMLLQRVIPAGQRVRRNFSFSSGEKGSLNRAYRKLVDCCLARRHRITGSFFSLIQCLQTNQLDCVADLAKTANVELMTHPEIEEESTYLMSEAYLQLISDLPLGTYAAL